MSAIPSVTETTPPENIEYNAPTNQASTNPQLSNGTNFSSMLAETMREDALRMTVTAGTGSSDMLGGYMPMQMQSQSLEQMILAAASSGEVSDAQAAMFMLLMMMQTSQDSDFSMLLQMMASMLGNIQDDAGSLRNSVMTSGYDPYVLDIIDWNVFNTIPTLGQGGTVLPLEFWRPALPSLTSSVGSRHPDLYTAVIAQFSVETAERYRPFRDGNTYCNIFMWDVTSAMGAEIPHYTDPATGDARYYPDTQGARGMTAVLIDGWLKTHGSRYGWRQVDAQTAQMYANAGRPAVTTGGSLDHVQVICPSRDGGYDPIRGVTIAQAGRIVTSYTHISSIYSASALNNISYWVHD